MITSYPKITLQIYIKQIRTVANLQLTLRTQLPLTMAIRTFNVLVQAPSASVAAITWVTSGLQNLDTRAPILFPNWTKRNYAQEKKQSL